MLNDQEWNELLNYLVIRLTEKGVTDTAEEVKIAASARIVEDDLTPPRPEASSTQEEFVLTGKVLIARPEEEKLEGLGSVMIRAPSAQETCIAAIEVLRTRLIELPDMGERLTSLLGKKPREIEWRLERDAALVPSGLAEFRCSDFDLNIDDSTAISHALEELMELLREA